jgi:hypothetical protein
MNEATDKTPERSGNRQTMTFYTFCFRRLAGDSGRIMAG